MSNTLVRILPAHAVRGNSQEFKPFYNETEGKPGFMDEANIFIPFGGDSFGGIPYGIATGTDTYSVTVTPDPSGTNPTINVKFTNENTGASTIDVNGAGAVDIIGIGGDPIEAGDIQALTIYELVFDGTNYQLIGEAVASGAVVPYGVSSGTNTYTTTLTPNPTPFQIGQSIHVKFLSTNTGASTLNANGAGAFALLNGGHPLIAGELVAGQIYGIVYDGTDLFVTGIVPATQTSGIISHTHVELAALKTGSSLLPGQWYFDTTDQVYLFATEVNNFSINAILKVSGTINNIITYVFVNASLQRRIISRTDIYNNTIESVFTTAITDFTFNNINIEENKVLQESSLAIIAPASVVNYNSIIIQSDVTVNDNHAPVNQNRISSSSININGTGDNASFSTNQITSSTVSAVTIIGSFVRNIVQKANIIIDNNGGNISDNKIYGDITIANSIGNDFIGNIIDLSGIIFLDKPESNRILENGASTFEATGTFALVEADYNAGTKTLTIPANYNYFGTIELNLNTGREIDNIIGMPTNHPVKFVVRDTKTVIFHPTAVATIAANQVTLESALDLTLTGYTDDSDYLVLSYNGVYSRQVEASVMA